MEPNKHNFRPPCRVEWLGCVGYREAWDLQRERAAQRLAGEIPDTLLLLEHPPTITLGRSAKREHLRRSVEELEAEGFAVVETDRGGDVTYHGAGQLVGYPIVHLQESPHQPDLHHYLRTIEEALLLALAEWGVVGERFEGYTGVWVGMGTPNPAKIAAIGVKASRWVTQHGFALNVAPDLSHFERIVPCGIADYAVTSLIAVLGREVGVEEVLPAVARGFEAAFGWEMIATMDSQNGETLREFERPT